MQHRRAFLKSSAMALAGVAMPWTLLHGLEQPGSAGLPTWERGWLEIHHIDTGRGNATLVLYPDGTSLLIDAGEAASAVRTMSPARPNDSRPAGDWIGRYCARQLDRVKNPTLDVALLTHLHGDHVGEVRADSPQSARGDYRLTGISRVAEMIEIREMIDRGWPDYGYPAPPRDATSLNYMAFAKALNAKGAKVQRAKAGSTTQLGMRHDAAGYPGFEARILSVNGSVWSGVGDEAKQLFPPVAGLAAAAMPTENMCSVSLRIDYGAFRHYSGGDLTSDTSYGLYPWHDIESPVAAAAGPVSVAVGNHHGYFDACGPAFVRALRPRVWILPTWSVSHAAMNVLGNLYSAELYAGPRLVFATGLPAETLLTTERFSQNLLSSDGHVVIRVRPDGAEFTVHVVDARDEAGTVLKTFGPIQA
jgi:Metallo-beta-lactamase superfamily